MLFSVEKNQPNQYIEFRREFELTDIPQQACLRISVDTNFTAWINNKLSGCGQFGDFPEKRTFSQIDVSDLLKVGKNALAILVHYCGEDTFSYLPGDAGLWYQVDINGKILAESDKRTLCRVSPNYLQEDTTRLTRQIGFSFNYNAIENIKKHKK